MNAIRCLLVDDEPPALEILRTYISKLPSLEIVGECYHAISAFEFLQHNPVDLIFLDVNMPQLLGTDFLKALPSPPQIIFTTAYREYAVEGFELGAIDYLLKPYSFDRFLKAVHRALGKEKQEHLVKSETTIKNAERFLYFKSDRKMIKVMLDDILYVEGMKDYVRIFLNSGQLITKQTITAIEAMLPEQEFIRIHRSFIASQKRISAYNQNSVFIGKTELPLGPLYKHNVLKALPG